MVNSDNKSSVLGYSSLGTKRVLQVKKGWSIFMNEYWNYETNYEAMKLILRSLVTSQNKNIEN